MRRPGCSRARTPMTPCVERDGATAVADDGACVGCGFFAPVQLTIDGGAVPYPLPKPRHMTERQRQVWLWGKTRGTLTTADVRRFYVDPFGALRRLEAFGAVERVGRGRWRAL